jgi:hypothetical protein
MGYELEYDPPPPALIDALDENCLEKLLYWTRRSNGGLSDEAAIGLLLDRDATVGADPPSST